MSLTIDRYHAQMGEGATKTKFPDGRRMSDIMTRFYATQRKLYAAPVVGHERLVNNLVNNRHIDGVERAYLAGHGLTSFANAQLLSGIQSIRTVAPATIMFANEPIADIYGTFVATEALEIAVEHAFDMPMTVASRAMDIKRAAGNRSVMDFSLRRNGDAERALEVSIYSYIGGFDSTSNGDAGIEAGIEWAGTVAHFWQQMFIGRHGEDGKHFEQIAFEAWLDANPNGTTLLLDTIDVRQGMRHAAAAACSTPERRKAFKSFRIDSGNLLELAIEASQYFESTGLTGLTAILTGDLDAEQIAKIVSKAESLKRIVFGVGTKLIAEVDRVAGVIYKICEVDGIPSLKGSNSIEKATLAGKLQVFRGVNDRGNYVGDVIGLDDEFPEIANAKEVHRLIQPFFSRDRETFQNTYFNKIPSVKEQREFVQEQIPKFGYMMNYPVSLSPKLDDLRHKVLNKMKENI